MSRRSVHQVFHVAAAAAVALVIGTTQPAVAQRHGTTAAPAALRDHIDAADDIVDALLDWRHVTIGQAGSSGAASQSTTLITVDASQVQRLQSALGALETAVPATGGSASQPRGDLRAHIEKARAIARELGPSTANQSPAVGTSGSSVTNAGSAASHSGTGLVTFDRTALQRLQIELNAMKMLAPRSH